MAISDLNVVIFAGESAGQEPTIFAGQPAGQPAGLTEGLPVGSGHEDLDRFHLCSNGIPIGKNRCEVNE